MCVTPAAAALRMRRCSAEGAGTSAGVGAGAAGAAGAGADGCAPAGDRMAAGDGTAAAGGGGGGAEGERGPWVHGGDGGARGCRREGGPEEDSSSARARGRAKSAADAGVAGLRPAIAALAACCASAASAVHASLRSLASAVLQRGAVPRHVAIIMDGNRRFSVARGLGRVAEGHALGYTTMVSVLDWLYDLGVSTVTVYAFSIENFKRPADEVETLMSLARDKLRELASALNSRRAAARGVRVRVIGDLELLPKGVREAAEAAMAATAHNEGATLNICLSYTARHEIAAAVHTVARQLRAEKARPETEGRPPVHGQDSRVHAPSSACEHARTRNCKCADVRSCASSDKYVEDLIERALMTDASEPPDLLLRTSGETRLSDFMLWQVRAGARAALALNARPRASCSKLTSLPTRTCACVHARTFPLQGGFAVLVFLDVLWPDFSFRHLLWALLQYQRHSRACEAHARAFRRAPRA